MLATSPSVAPETPGARPILLIEDEAAMAESLQYSFESEGMKVVVASDGLHGLERFRIDQPSLVLLDLMLPKMSGLDVCRALRGQSTVPIVILTAKDSETDKVTGLEVGADDYVTKPFSMRELISRVRAQLRRAGMDTSPVNSEVLVRGPVAMDTARHEVSIRGRNVVLPPKEFRLLEDLLQARGRLRTRTSLIDDVWGPNYFGDTKTLDVHIKRLRHKIERDHHHPQHLLTVRGLGYRFVDHTAGARDEG